MTGGMYQASRAKSASTAPLPWTSLATAQTGEVKLEPSGLVSKSDTKPLHPLGKRWQQLISSIVYSFTVIPCAEFGCQRWRWMEAHYMWQRLNELEETYNSNETFHKIVHDKINYYFTYFSYKLFLFLHSEFHNRVAPRRCTWVYRGTLQHH